MGCKSRINKLLSFIGISKHAPLASWSTGRGAGAAVTGEKLAEAAGLSVPRVYQIRDGRR